MRYLAWFDVHRTRFWECAQAIGVLLAFVAIVALIIGASL